VFVTLLPVTSSPEETNFALAPLFYRAVSWQQILSLLGIELGTFFVVSLFREISSSKQAWFRRRSSTVRFALSVLVYTFCTITSPAAVWPRTTHLN
jgi:hypothetical protein